MELRYCDQCGSVQNEPADEGFKPGSRYLCRACRGEEEPASATAGETPASGQALSAGTEPEREDAATQSVSAEGDPLRLFDVAQEESRKAPPSERAAKPEHKRDGLDLFSAKSLALKMETLGKPRPPAARRAGAGRSGGASPAAAKPERKERQPEAAAPAPSGDSREPESSPLKSDDSLRLFSKQTVALRKKQHFARETQQEAGTESRTSGSVAPARSATRIQFRCIHCRSKLLIRPVRKLGKLVCPRCNKTMYIDAHGKISRAAKDPVEAGAATPEDQTVVATFDGQAGGAASATVPAVATPRHGPRPASGAKGSKALSTLVRNTQKQTSQQSRAAAGASPAAVAPQPSAQETLEQVFPNPRTPEAPSEEEFLTGLLDDLESSFGSPWSDESKEFSPESLSLQAAEFDASYARVAYPAAGRSYLQAVVFGFLLCSPLLVATFFVHETRTNPAEATGLDRAVIRTLESIGGAVRHAYTKLYDQFSAE